jgi:hypothetical protein
VNKGSSFQVGVACTAGFVSGFCLYGEADFRWCSAAAGGVDQRKFGGDLDAAAGARRLCIILGHPAAKKVSIG